jgi:hypothetical protein
MRGVHVLLRYRLILEAEDGEGLVALPAKCPESRSAVRSSSTSHR